MKIKYKILSVIACFSILLSSISISAFAEAKYDYPTYDQIVTDGLSGVTYGEIANYAAYKLEVGSVLPYSFFKSLYLSHGLGASTDSVEEMKFNIFCDIDGKLQPMFTTEYVPSITIYCWSRPYNNNDRNLAISAGAGANDIWVSCDDKPKFTITQDSDGYIYFRYTSKDYLKSTKKYTGGNLYLMFTEFGNSAYQGLITDCQSYFNNDSFIENEGMYGEIADFITFPKTSNDVGILPIYLKSWLSDGYQYPYLEFYIDTNTIHGSYRLEVSKSNCPTVLGGIIQKYTEPFYTSGNISTDLKNISNALNLVPDVAVNPSWDSNRLNEFNRQGYHKLLSPFLNNNCSFENVASISTDAFNFSGSSDRIRYYSLCLSDYCDINNSDTYRLQIVSDSKVLATTYFNSYDKFLRNATPVGDSHSVGYTDKDTFNNDASTGSYVSGTRNDINAFNNKDTPSISPNTNLYNNIGNGDFFTALDSTLKGLQGFFYGCYAIIPPAIISIILGSLAIIVVMRVLGR